MKRDDIDLAQSTVALGELVDAFLSARSITDHLSESWAETADRVASTNPDAAALLRYADERWHELESRGQTK